nr:energy transducer TonB [Pontibacter harenae]
MTILGRHIRYPAAAVRADAMGVVVIAVELSETGQVLSYKLEKSVGYSMDEEAIRVFKLIPNDWFPAIAAGKPVRSIYYFPVRFSIK